jgi:DNA end-binding protein Ku
MVERATRDGKAKSEKAGGDGAVEPEARRRASGGAGRGIWSGSISFGLLQIPVTLHTAERRSEKLHFRLLDKRDFLPVRYERVNAVSGEPVEWKDIVKGYEIQKDEFVVVDPEDLKKANVKATQTIDILDFVPREQIDPVYFDTPYYVVPQPRAKKAYVLLRDALAKKGAVAIATFVLRTREHLAAIMPVGHALMLEILRFGHELKEAEDIPLPTDIDAQAVSDRELAMAEQLIEGMMTDWDPSKYKDRYYRDVMRIIEEKAKTGAVTEHHAKVEGTVATDVVDLLDLLKKSVSKASRAANDQRPGLGKAGTRKKTKRRRAA